MPSRSTLAEATAELAKLTGQTWTVRDLLEYCAQKLIPLQAKVSIEERDIDAVRQRQRNPPIWQNAARDFKTFAAVQTTDIWMLKEDGRAAIKHPADGPRSWPVRNLPVTTDNVVVAAETLLKIHKAWQKEQPHDSHVRLYWSTSDSNGRALGADTAPQAAPVSADTVAPPPATEGAVNPPDAPVVALPASETPEQRRARWLDWCGKGERGAVQRVYERELQQNPKADRSFIGKQIKLARTEQAEKKRGGGWVSQLVNDGKRSG